MEEDYNRIADKLESLKSGQDETHRLIRRGFSLLVVVISCFAMLLTVMNLVV
jgi:hypothetical protein